MINKPSRPFTPKELSKMAKILSHYSKGMHSKKILHANTWKSRGGWGGNGSAGYGAGGYGSASQFPWGTSTTTMANANSMKADERKGKNKSIEISVSQAKNLLLRILKTDIVPFLWGPPGVGKSSIVREICQEKKWKLIDLRLSLLNPVDLRGLPVVNREVGTASWFPPAFLPQNGTKEEGVLFLDEINLAPLSVQAAAYQLILDKKVGEYVFPSNWRIIAAGNRETDRANVYKISAPLANRFVHIFVRPDFEAWKQWAVGRLRGEIIHFLILRAVLLFKMPQDSEKAFPSPRTWEFLSDLMNAYGYENGKTDPREIEELAVGAIGATAYEFLKFLGTPDLTKIAKQIEDFPKTGKISLPSSPSERYAVITAITQIYKEGGLINKKLYDSFLKMLSDEEKEVAKTYGHKFDN